MSPAAITIAAITTKITAITITTIAAVEIPKNNKITFYKYYICNTFTPQIKGIHGDT